MLTAYIYTNIGLVCIFVQVGDKGYAVGIEHIKELNDQAIKNVEVDSPELLKSKKLTLLGRTHFYCIIDACPPNVYCPCLQVVWSPETMTV